MPRRSAKQLALKRLDGLIAILAKQVHVLHLLGVDNSQQFDVLYKCQFLRKKVESNRYFVRGEYNRNRTPKFHIYLTDEGSKDNALTESAFLCHFRIPRSAFWELVHLLKDHGVFHRASSGKGPKPKPASHQLLVLLKYFGSEGDGASNPNLARFFGVGAGTIHDCRTNALEALLSLLEKETHYWPTPEERKSIANRIEMKWHVPNCVGLIDGTVLPLAARPLLHGSFFY
ncbi:expressed unknown protein [Seminavis robusta]|uniref:DDE Tnp4 domain-containing protein n=1 Tax=Seminavis robusta TaxID=568900 RepID=A0A9N8EFF6_9STRA|nr:expressed unknown protein [Seminavis robusta]|eukprot:Sro1015_g231531.1  (230) ;mRNA; r:24348-25037